MAMTITNMVIMTVINERTLTYMVVIKTAVTYDKDKGNVVDCENVMNVRILMKEHDVDEDINKCDNNDDN
jgi:hypothetical protein